MVTSPDDPKEEVSSMPKKEEERKDLKKKGKDKPKK